MKKGLIVLVFLGLASMMRGTAAEEQEFRIFTAKDGRTLDARIVGNIAAQDQVRIERRNGKKVWVAPDIFSDADQVYIREWVAADLFLSESMLKVSVAKSEGNGYDTKNARGPTIVTPVYYEIHLNNRSAINFNQLKIDYRLYIGEKMYGGGNGGFRCVAGLTTLKSLPAGAKKSCWTKPENLITQFRSQREFNTVTKEFDGLSSFKTSKDEARGILIRLQGPAVGGVPTVRELSYPSGFSGKVEWTESTGKKEPLADDQLSYDELMEKAEKYCFGFDVKKDYETSIELYQRALELNPERAPYIGYKLCAIHLSVCTRPHLVLAEEWAEKEKTYDMYFALARFYGSHAPSEFLNGEKAVKYASKAAEKNADALVYLAIAYARNGQFDLAVETQEEALKHLKRSRYSKTKLKQYKFMKELFEQKKAYSEGMEKEAQ